MEELRQAAIAYYKNAPADIQKLALNYFGSMDKDGDGQVSLTEFVAFLQQNGCEEIKPDFFRELDSNGDGNLDFSEVLTLYYMAKTRTVGCNECLARQKGLYFTCVTCFDSVGQSYDLCSDCYSQRTFNHQHTYFLDTYVLLQTKRGSPAASHKKRFSKTKALEAVKNLCDIGGTAASVGCSIM